MDFQLKPHLQKPDSAHSTTCETMIFHQTSLDICPTRQNHTFILPYKAFVLDPSKFPLKENSFGKIELGAMQNEIEPCWTASKTRIWVKARLELKSQNWIWNWKTELKYSWISFYRGSENLSRSQTVTRNLCWKKLPNPQVEGWEKIPWPMPNVSENFSFSENFRKFFRKFDQCQMFQKRWRAQPRIPSKVMPVKESEQKEAGERERDYY